MYIFIDVHIDLSTTWRSGIAMGLSQDLDAIVAVRDKRGRTPLELAELLAHRDGNSSDDAFVGHLRGYDDTRRGVREG